MSLDHDPDQIASSLTVSKVAGDQSLRERRSPCAVSDVICPAALCKRGLMPGDAKASGQRDFEFVEQSPLAAREVVVRYKPEPVVPGRELFSCNALKIIDRHRRRQFE